MFTPEGYWSWNEVVEASMGWSRQIVIRSMLPEFYQKSLKLPPYKVEDAILETLVSKGKCENLSEARFAMGLMELWLLANFMDQYEAVLCSSDGRTLRCPPILKSHGDAFDWWISPLSKEKCSNGEGHGYFRYFREGKFNIPDAQARFTAIDFGTGTIQLKPNTVGLLNGASYGHSLDEGEALRFIDNQIRPIIGWSICWNENVFPETERELFIDLGFEELDWSDLEETSSKSPTPSSYINIYNCVMAAYPDGKGTAIWDDVVARVGYSRRSIRRALMNQGTYKTWAKRGQE